MKLIRIIRHLTLSASFLLYSTQISAQELSIQITSVKNDSVAFHQESKGKYPGGWCFDMLGFNINTSGKKKSHDTYHIKSGLLLFGGWGFGFCDAVNADASVNVSMGNSFHFCIEDLLSYRFRLWKKGALSVGMGIDLRNYRMTGHNRFAVDPFSQTITIDGYPAGTIPGTSKLRTFSTTYNLKYIQQLNRKFSLAFGPELSVVRKPAKKHLIRTTYTDSQGEQKEVFKGVRTNKVGVNLVGMVSYRKMVGIYAKYGLYDVLNPDFGPSFHGLSVGVMVMGI